jgi:hypothetical protein
MFTRSATIPMQSPIAACRKRKDLESRYHVDLNVYREAVVALGPPDDFALPYAKSELARLHLERAHTALKDHIAEHQCG